MSDKARIEREKPEIYYAPSSNTQKKKEQVEQNPETSTQNELQQTPDPTGLVKWPLLLGSVTLLVALLGIGYFYGSGAIDEFSSVTLAITITLLVTGITAALWWLKHGR